MNSKIISAILATCFLLTAVACKKEQQSTGQGTNSEPEIPSAGPTKNPFKIPSSINGTRTFSAWYGSGYVSATDTTVKNKNAIDEVTVSFTILTDTTLVYTINFKDSVIGGNDTLELFNHLSSLRYPGSYYYKSKHYKSGSYAQFYSDTLGNHIPLFLRSYSNTGNNTINEQHFELKQK